MTDELHIPHHWRVVVQIGVETLRSGVWHETIVDAEDSLEDIKTAIRRNGFQLSGITYTLEQGNPLVLPRKTIP